jgi:hypothetical protein
MTHEEIHKLVKNLEPLFIGYTANEDCLKNENGMVLRFRSDWHNKTTVSGLHAKKCHSIGCSFNKPLGKIFKDIRRRLMPDYHADFFENKREKNERAEIDEENLLKLKALASVIEGGIGTHYGYGNSLDNKFVDAENVSIYQTYSRGYEFKINLNYIEAMKLAQYLKEASLINKKSTK